jgi:hypothetical protein
MSDRIPFDRYQFKPYLGSSHEWALLQLEKFPPTTNLLDFGSGSGAIGRTLMEKGWSNLSAIEIDDTTRKNSSQWYHESAKELKNLTKNKFGLILLLDIIEHLINPVDFLQDIVTYCENECTLLISVPNVAHWAVRLLALLGRFEYMERGPLDATHLHFFTKGHLRKSIEKIPGLTIKEWDASIVPLELMVPEYVKDNAIFKLNNRVRLFCARRLPELCAYQLLVRVTYRSVESSNK